MTHEPLPPMPATMPMLVFVHPLDDNYARLRGRAYFEMIREGGFDVVTSADPGGVSVPTNRRLLIFAAIAGDAPLVDALLDLAASPSTCVLVDVPGPVWAPEQIIGSDDARAFWSWPENQDRAYRLVTAADGVTTPHAALVEPLLEVNPNVFVLPDLTHDDDECGCEAAERFGRTLMLAWHTATELKMARLAEAQRCAAT